MSKITEMADALLRESVTALGFELYDVEYAKEQGSWVLTLFIDAPAGVTIEDCEKVSRAVEPILDEADPIPDSYYLSVSSVGLDRPLKKDKDFERNLGEKITVKLYAPKDGVKELTGALVSFTAENFTVETQSGEITLARKDAAKITPYISFD